MLTQRTIVTAVLAGVFAAMGFFMAVDFGDGAPALRIVPEAAAVIGRPATPLSVAGVARRTTRRVIRRSSIYLNALPPGCPIVQPGLYACGGSYYQPYRGRYVVVYVD